MTSARLVGVVIALKLLVLAIDATIRLYLGDSAAYLAGGQSSSWLPSDRSFVYSLLIRALVHPTGSLWALLVWQTVAGIGVAVLLWVTLTRHLGVPRPLAFVAACVLAVEPAQLYYERMVLAETFGLLAFAGFFAAGGAYLVSARAAWLPVVAVLGLAAASLRLNYLPVVLVVSVILPLVRVLDPLNRPPWRLLLTHAIVALCSVGIVHTAYRHVVAAVFHVEPTYMARDGFMQLGLVTPLITPEHLARVGLPPDLGETLAYPLADRRARLAHMWAPGGLTQELTSRNLDVARIGRELSRLAIADDPVGFARLGLETTGDYFRRESRDHALQNDLGQREIPGDLLQSLRDVWGYDATGLHTRVTPVGLYFAGGTWWLVACLFLMLPLTIASLALQWRRPQRPAAVLLALVSIGLVMAHVLFVNVPFYRYLHPLPFFALLNLLPLIDAVHHRAGRRASQAGPGSDVVDQSAA
jgi:hypothetical protein